MALNPEEMMSMFAMMANPNNSKMMDDIREQLGQIEEAQKKNALLVEQNNKILAAIKAETAKNEELLASLAEQHQKLTEKADNFSKMVDQHNANQRTWEDNRATLSEQQAAKEAELNQRHATLEGMQRDHLAKAKALKDQQAAVNALMVKHKAAADHARRFYEAVA